MNSFQKLSSRLGVFLIILFTSELSSATTQYIAKKSIWSSNGYEVKIGMTVDGLGVNDVPERLSSSGQLLTFLVGSEIHTADADAFEEVKNNSNIATTLFHFENAGDTARMCTSFYGYKDDSFVVPQDEIERYVRIVVDGAPVKFSVKVPAVRKGDKPKKHNLLRPAEKDVCFEGLPFSSVFTFEFLPGLSFLACTGCDSLKLNNKLTVWGSSGSKPSALALSSGQTLLSMGQSALVPVTVTNIDKIDVELFKIDLRSLTKVQDLYASIRGYNVDSFGANYAKSMGTHSVSLDVDKNQSKKINIDISKFIPAAAPGVYVAVFNSPNLNLSRYSPWPTQWLIRSNLSVSTYHGRNKVDILINRFDSMDALEGVDVEVLAKNNRLLFKGLTDNQGRVNIPQNLISGTGQHAPEFLLARHGDEGIALLDFNASGETLRVGQSGHEKKSNRDIYLTTDRELYRAGETLQYLLIGRHDSLDALAGVDLKIELINPSGSTVSETVQRTDRFGFVSAEFTFKSNARLGSYNLRVSGMDDQVLADTVVSVEDFVPLTIESKLDAPELWSADKKAAFVLKAEYFSGGPAAELNAEVIAALSYSNVHESREFADYLFGSKSSVASVHLKSFKSKLDKQGLYKNTLKVSRSAIRHSGLYSVSLKGDAYDVGGRPNGTLLKTPLSYTSTYVGVRPLFNRVVEEGVSPLFNWVAITREGEVESLKQVEYELRSIDYSFDWYYSDGWRYHSKRVSDRLVTAGVAKSADISLPATLDWGAYELVVKSDSGFKTIVPFRVGWYGDGPVTEPSLLALSVESLASDQLKVKLNAPFAGNLRIMQAGSDIEYFQNLSIKKGDNEITIKQKQVSEPGFHILATLTRPVIRGTEHLPQIAVGTQWVSHLAADREIKTTIQTASKQRSDEYTTVSVNVGSSLGKGRIFLVDEGIHAITNFKNTDPRDFFFGPRALSIGFLSNFGQLIQQDDSLDAFGMGGDQQTGAANVSKSDFFKTVVASSPLLDIVDGVIEYRFSAPDVEGRLRAVVLVADERGVGFNKANITVQDRVSLDVSLPRFVGAGDKVNGKFALRFNEQIDNLALKRIVGESSTTEDLTGFKKNDYESRDLLLENLAAGEVPVSLNVQYDNADIRRDYNLVVRDRSYPITQLRALQLQKSFLRGSTFKVKPLEMSGFTDPDRVDITWSLSPLPGASLAQLIASLDRYPYGCIEQFSSITRGVLSVAQIQGINDELRKKINHGIDGILAKQKTNGAFGYWSRLDRIESEYLPFAVETLIQSMPYANNPAQVQTAIDKAFTYLDRQYFDDAWTAMYTYGVLTQSGFEVKSRARYVLDEQLPDAIAKEKRGSQQIDLLVMGYWLAALIQDDKRSSMIHLELEKLLKTNKKKSIHDVFSFASSWFDPASVDNNKANAKPWTAHAGIMLSSLPKSYQSATINQLMVNGIQTLSVLKYRSTLMNANLAALLGNQANVSDAINVQINGQPMGVDLDISSEMAQTGFQLKHDFDGDLYLSAELVGERISRTAESNGFSVNKFWFDDAGLQVDDNSGELNASQGDIFTVVVTFSAMNEHESGNLMLTDLLPSGFEIDTTSNVEPYTLDKGKKVFFNKLGLKADWIQSMDDRFTANFHRYWRKGDLGAIYYQVRATYTGEFVVPDAHVELMYRPQINGRSSMAHGQITVQ
ncbi:MG2 domain-containing protein [Pseudomonadales bacterium]|nr:MG2 domain-containing protein [Pseudomonadales bacterium]